MREMFSLPASVAALEELQDEVAELLLAPWAVTCSIPSGITGHDESSTEHLLLGGAVGSWASSEHGRKTRRGMAGECWPGVGRGSAVPGWRREGCEVKWGLHVGKAVLH